MFRKIQKLLRSTKGVATSLLEATATIAVGATLAGAAITVVTDKVQQARIAATAQDVQMIGDAINNFEKDAGFYPIFKTAGTNNASTGPDPDAVQGSNTGSSSSSRTNVDLLQSAAGDEPDLASGGIAGTSGAAPLANLNAHASRFDAAGHPGHSGGGASGTPGWRSTNFDTIESQLSLNSPAYVVRGAFTFDRKRGFNGPYLAKVPPTDAWGNRFKVNALYLDDHRVSNGESNPFMTFVLSAGPNEQIQSRYEVTSQNVGDAIGGDDILFRIR